MIEKSRLDSINFITGVNIMKILSYLKDKVLFLIAFVVRRLRINRNNVWLIKL